MVPRVAAFFVWLIARAESQSDCNRCTDRTPVTQGSFSAHTFVPDSGCYHTVPDVADTFALLAGSWLVTSGGSNSWATYTALANQMQPGYYSFHSERTASEGAQFADLIWERQLNGTWSLVHDSFVCGGGCDGESSQWHTTDMGAAQFPAEGLPQHSANHVRLSFFAAKLFPETAHDLEYLSDAPDGWSAARQILYIQNGRWYANRRAGTPEGYHPDLLTFLTDHTGLCGQSHVDCFIATISCVKELTVELWKWSRCDSVVNDLNQITKDLTLLPQFSAYHYMDVTSLLSAKAEEYSGHNGPPLGLWTWQLMMN